MAKVTFQVIDGVDKGRVFRELATPVTMGREEGNTIRLNDERISRFHAKVQFDQGDLILTDLDSTNGTRVNGRLIQIHRLRFGDYVMVGRSVLLYGSMEEIQSRQTSAPAPGVSQAGGNKTVRMSVAGNLDRPTVTATARDAAEEAELQFSISEQDKVVSTPDSLLIGNYEFPPLPQKLSPSQGARLSEIVNLLHRMLAQITQQVTVNDEGTQVTLDFATWQRLLQLEMLLARYHRAVTDPDSWEE
jgi:pSer/pThr/pTyr-binding forkhead associated (FHA) protein